MQPRLEPYDHPAAWKASGVQGKEDFVVELAEKHCHALAEGVQKLKTKGKTDFHKIGRDDFALESISDDLAEWQHEIRDGKGL